MKYALEPFIRAGGGLIVLIIFAVMSLINMHRSYQSEMQSRAIFCKDCPSKGKCIYQDMTGGPEENCPDKEVRAICL